MITLKNIKINGKVIESDIYPEDSEKNGNLKIDTETGSIISYFLPIGYEWCTSHLNHAKNTLVELSKSKKIPKEKIVMWY